MRIVYDHQIFSLQIYGGISRYFFNLSEQLVKNENLDITVLSPLYLNSYLKVASHDYVKGIPFPGISKSSSIVRSINSFLTPFLMDKYHPDIVHETYYSKDSYAPNKSVRVVTVYDMIHERFPDIFSPSDKSAEVKRASIERANFIICISENTRQDLLDIYNLNEEKVATVHLGFDLIQKESTSSLRNKSINKSEDYLLYVGHRQTYKNFVNLLKAYAASNWLKNNFKLYCFGGGKFNLDEITLMSKLGLSSNQVIQVSGDDSQLEKAYRGATALVYPSLYEGFGIPLLESMALDCPVICSNTSSLPEVVGIAGEYFDPKSPESIAVALENVLNSEAKRIQLIKQGKKQLINFSWEKCAEETLNIYYKIL
jgi:glycosyltransferase involved in cell wall biosynthesis